MTERYASVSEVVAERWLAGVVSKIEFSEGRNGFAFANDLPSLAGIESERRESVSWPIGLIDEIDEVSWPIRLIDEIDEVSWPIGLRIGGMPSGILILRARSLSIPGIDGRCRASAAGKSVARLKDCTLPSPSDLAASAAGTGGDL